MSANLSKAVARAACSAETTAPAINVVRLETWKKKLKKSRWLQNALGNATLPSGWSLTESCLYRHRTVPATTLRPTCATSNSFLEGLLLERSRRFQENSDFGLEAEFDSGVLLAPAQEAPGEANASCSPSNLIEPTEDTRPLAGGGSKRPTATKLAAFDMW